MLVALLSLEHEHCRGGVGLTSAELQNSWKRQAVVADGACGFLAASPAGCHDVIDFH